eukprot:1840501-Amphidinium_carterae.1
MSQGVLTQRSNVDDMMSIRVISLTLEPSNGVRSHHRWLSISNVPLVKRQVNMCEPTAKNNNP